MKQKITLSVFVIMTLLLFGCNKFDSQNSFEPVSGIQNLNEKSGEIVVDPSFSTIKIVHRGDLLPEYTMVDGRRVSNRDRDQDGFPNGSDNCPSVYNPDQKDTDKDGIGDACDTVNDDLDGDGVLNSFDNCPNTPNPDQKDTDGDGIGDVCDTNTIIDTDKDGVPDSQDNCPTVANANQADWNSNGIGDDCDAAVPPMPVYKWVFLLDFDGYTHTYCYPSSPDFPQDGYYPPSKLSQIEIKNIVDSVRFDFRNFPVTITTDETVFQNANEFYRLRVVINDRKDCSGCGNGGMAYQDLIPFSHEVWLNNPQKYTTLSNKPKPDCSPALIWDYALNYNQMAITKTISHEIGHTLGLQHQSFVNCGTGTCNEYYGGGSSPYTPIMGGGNLKPYYDWHIGQGGCSPCGTPLQNDTLIIGNLLRNGTYPPFNF